MDNGKLINHVVVLMLENRSFDQMLGDYQNYDKKEFSGLEGIDAGSPLHCIDQDRHPYTQSPTASRTTTPDPPHELDNVLRQLGLPAPAPPPTPDWLSGDRLQRFIDTVEKIAESYRVTTLKAPRTAAITARKANVLDPANFINEYANHGGAQTPQQRQEILNYFPRGFLPALHGLADNFLVCDHWFSSVPGPTWANRFFVHSGTSCGVARMAENVTDYWGYDVYNQDTIFDRLSDKSVPWRIYCGDIPQSILLLNQAKKGNLSNYRLFGQFEGDVAREGQAFPAYVFIEPSYRVIGNDDHPPHDVFAGQNLIAAVYNAIRGNDALWRDTLLIVVYDEHGGFYDHVPPPAATPPGGIDMQEWTFDSLGLRVPAILISPYVRRGVFSNQLEHASLLRFLIERFDLDQLTDRTKTAESFASEISDKFRTDRPAQIHGGSFVQHVELAAVNELQKALILVAHWVRSALGQGQFLSAARTDGAATSDRVFTGKDFDDAFAIVKDVMEKRI
jgi:hypothetical protein